MKKSSSTGSRKPVPALSEAFVLTAALADASFSPRKLTAVADACGMRRLQRGMPLHECSDLECYCSRVMEKQQERFSVRRAARAAYLSATLSRCLR
jgi:hypothetical protein